MRQKFTIFLCLLIWQIGNSQTTMDPDQVIEDKEVTDKIYHMPFEITEEGDTIVIIDQMPLFPGGEQKMLEFLFGNIKYPPFARTNGIEGLVVVSFIINEDGSLSDVSIKREIGGGCGAEAVRVVESMPTWTPGSIDGIPIKVSYNLPVRFKLGKTKKKKRK